MFRTILKAVACAAYIYFMLEAKRAAEQQNAAKTVYSATIATCALIIALHQ